MGLLKTRDPFVRWEHPPKPQCSGVFGVSGVGGDGTLPKRNQSWVPLQHTSLEPMGGDRIIFESPWEVKPAAGVVACGERHISHLGCLQQDETRMNSEHVACQHLTPPDGQVPRLLFRRDNRARCLVSTGSDQGAKGPRDSWHMLSMIYLV